MLAVGPSIPSSIKFGEGVRTLFKICWITIRPSRFEVVRKDADTGVKEKMKVRRIEDIRYVRYLFMVL